MQPSNIIWKSFMKTHRLSLNVCSSLAYVQAFKRENFYTIWRRKETEQNLQRREKRSHVWKCQIVLRTCLSLARLRNKKKRHLLECELFYGLVKHLDLVVCVALPAWKNTGGPEILDGLRWNTLRVSQVCSKGNGTFLPLQPACTLTISSISNQVFHFG